MSPERRDLALGALLAVLVLAVNSAWVSWHVGFIHKAKRLIEADHLHYIEMVKSPPDRPELAKTPPYCFRVLTPTLVRGLMRLGLSLNAAFYVFTNAVLFGFLLMLWLLMRDLEYGQPARVVGMGIVGLTQGPVRWFEYQYWMSDPPCLFLLALGLYFMRRERFLPLAVVSVVAAFCRETYVVLYPCFFVREWMRSGFVTAVRRTVTLVAVPAVILVTLRLTIPALARDNFLEGIVDSMSFRWRHLSDNQPYVLTIGTWGVALPLALLFPRRLAAAIRRQPDLVMLLLCVYATLIISNNTERPLAYAVPAVLAAALYGFERFVVETRLPLAAVAAAVLALQLHLWIVTRFTGDGMSIYQPTNLGVVAAMLAFWVGAEALWRLRAQNPRTVVNSSLR
jgi:hypothetical protein